MGCILEFGRKLRVPENEREGVETYSKLLGVKTAVNYWTGFLVISAGLLVYMGYLLTAPVWVAAAALPVFLFLIRTGRDFSAAPTTEKEQKMENLSGLWVVVCYGLAGFLPLLIARAGL